MKKVILTFDYEVFLGTDTGSVKKSVLDPVERLIDIFKRTSAIGIFFVDTLWLEQMKKHTPDDYILVKRQLQKLVMMDCRIELHLHPHWLDSSFLDGKFVFRDFSKFRLHALNEAELLELFDRGTTLLNTIANEINPDYVVNAFRAGGWSVQPFDLLKSSFLNSGISFDMSVLPGMRLSRLPHHYYNFTSVPNKSSWQFENSVETEQVSGSFIEIPTTVLGITPYEYIRNKFEFRGEEFFGDGRGLALESSIYSRLLGKLTDLNVKFTTDYVSPWLFKRILKRLKSDVHSFVAHPKIFTESSLILIETICESFETVSHEDY